MEPATFSYQSGHSCFLNHPLPPHHDPTWWDVTPAVVVFLQAERPAAPMEPALPVFSQDEVAKHGSLEAGVWVTFRGGVYDITEFVAMHPGGDKILLAAGGALEPFWALYAVHSQDHVLEILSEYKVGRPSPDRRAQRGLGPH